MKVDPTVKKETIFVSIVTLLLSAVMESVFLIICKWDIPVLFGNLLGAVTGVINFFLMGLTVQKAVTSDEDRARQLMKTSHALRFAGIVLIMVFAVVFPRAFNIWTTLISLLFATFAVYLRPLFNKARSVDKTGKKSVEEGRNDAAVVSASETAAEDGGNL